MGGSTRSDGKGDGGAAFVFLHDAPSGWMNYEVAVPSRGRELHFCVGSIGGSF